MSRGLYGIEIIPPYTGSTAKLLGGIISFTRVSTRYSQKSELRFNDMKPGISVQRFFSLTEKWRLGTKKVLIACLLRIEVVTTSSELLTLLVLLCLYQQIKEFGLPSYHLGWIWRWRWRLLRTAGLICPESFRGSTRGSNHLKQGRHLLLTT
jgi:hypothetical protein